MLIDKGCDIKLLDVQGTSPFEEAVKKDQVQVSVQSSNLTVIVC